MKSLKMYAITIHAYQLTYYYKFIFNYNSIISIWLCTQQVALCSSPIYIIMYMLYAYKMHKYVRTW